MQGLLCVLGPFIFFSKRVTPGASLTVPMCSSLRCPHRPVSFHFINTSFVLITEVCPTLPDTFIAALFPGLGNHAELEILLEGTMWRKFQVGLSKRLSLTQQVKHQSWKFRVYRKAPSRAGPFQELLQETRPARRNQSHQNWGKQTFLMVEETLRKPFPGSLVRAARAFSTDTCSCLPSMLERSLGQPHFIRPSWHCLCFKCSLTLVLHCSENTNGW